MISYIQNLIGSVLLSLIQHQFQTIGCR